MAYNHRGLIFYGFSAELDRALADLDLANRSIRCSARPRQSWPTLADKCESARGHTRLQRRIVTLRRLTAAFGNLDRSGLTSDQTA